MDSARHDPLAYSRPFATADRLGDDAPDRHRFIDKRALLTGDPTVLATANGRVMMLTALRLLPRLTPHVMVWVPGAPAPLLALLRREAKRIAFGGEIVISDASTPPAYSAEVDAVLSVGPGPTRQTAGDHDSPDAMPLDMRWTTIVSNGWCVWVTRGARPIAVATSQRNAVGAVFAASLGVAEVFKVLLALKPERGAPADGTPFSLFTYRVGESDPGPEIGEELALDAVLLGMGAIGNGIVAVLQEFTLRGRVVVIDRQTYGRENLGTCVLLGPADVGSDKPSLAVRHLAHSAPGFVIDPRPGEAADVLRRVDPVPSVVLNGLDNRDARREAQRLWADLTVDGAIGDFMCQVSRHPGDPDVDTACLRCLYEPDTGVSAGALVAAATGLRVDRAHADDVVRDDDVDAAPLEHREALRAQVGRPICSVTSEAMARSLSTVEQRAGFEPSVPFVATASAAMVVGEWVKSVHGMASVLEPRFQFDILHGPAGGIEFPEARHDDCDCTQRRLAIAQARAARQARHARR